MLLAAVFAGNCGAALAQVSPTERQTVPATVGASIDPLRQRFKSLAAADLKEVYRQCSRQSLERRMDGGEAVFCSTAYDVLLKAHFGGDFGALLNWSQQEHGADDSAVGPAALRRQRDGRRIHWH